MGSLTWDREIQGFPSSGFESGGEGTDDKPWGEDWMQKVIAAQWGENGLILVGDAFGAMTTLDSKDFSIINQVSSAGVAGVGGSSPFRNVLSGMWCRTAADPVNGQPLWLLGGIKNSPGPGGKTAPLIVVSTDGGVNIEQANMPSSPFTNVDGTTDPTGFVDAFSYDLASGTMYARLVGFMQGPMVFFIISSGDGQNWTILSGPYTYTAAVSDSSPANIPGLIGIPPAFANNKLARLGCQPYPYAVGTLKSTTPGKSGGTYVAQMVVDEPTELLTSLTFTGIGGTSSSFSSMPPSPISEPIISWTAGKFILAGGVGPVNNLIPAIVWTDDGKTWNEIDNITPPQPPGFSNGAGGVAAGPKGNQAP